MKEQLLNHILTGIILILSFGVNATTNSPYINDSLQYELKLSKSVFVESETIIITLITKNITNHEISIWIDSGNYPTGTQLKLVNVEGDSMIKEYWASLTSQLYTLEEVNKMKTNISPNQQFRKDYRLLNIIQLNEKLPTGKYELRFGNAKPIKFEVK